eukprot:1649413-Amphidinium_carterae.1
MHTQSSARSPFNFLHIQMATSTKGKRRAQGGIEATLGLCGRLDTHACVKSMTLKQFLPNMTCNLLSVRSGESSVVLLVTPHLRVQARRLGTCISRMSLQSLEDSSSQ